MDYTINGTTNDITIDNRTSRYHVNKEVICSSIPHFQMIFDGESKGRIAQLDLDDDAFNTILNKIYGQMYIVSIETVVPVYNVAEYLKMNGFMEECKSYLINSFSTRCMELVLSQLKYPSKLANMVDAFICRHFDKIVHTRSFLSFSEATMDRILQLDLMVDSEMQVLKSIMRWNSNQSRPDACISLLKRVRWCHLKCEFVKLARTLAILLPDMNANDFREFLCSDDKCKSQCSFNRCKSEHLVVISKLDATRIAISAIDESNRISPLGVFTADSSLSVNLLCDEGHSDIVYDSGSQGIRIDWIQRKYRLHELKDGSFKSYYRQMWRCLVVDFDKEEGKKFHLNGGVRKQIESDLLLVSPSLLEVKGQFHAVCPTASRRTAFSSLCKLSHWFSKIDFPEKINSVFDGRCVYLLNNQSVLEEYNIESRAFRKFEFLKESKLIADNLQMTLDVPMKQIYVLDKSTKRLYKFDLLSKRFQSPFLLVGSNPILALTKTRLPLKLIEPLFHSNKRAN